MALTFASLFGWLLAIAGGLLLLNEIAVEEKHLRELFGLCYESYARTTAKVFQESISSRGLASLDRHIAAESYSRPRRPVVTSAIET